MGRKIPVVSFLCGALSRKKNTPQNPVAEPAPRKDDSDSGASPPSQGSESPPDHEQPPANAAVEPPVTDQDELQNQPLPLPPPPGRLQPQHMRAASCHHQHTRSNSKTAIRRVSSSLSMRMLSSASRREEAEKKNKNKLKHEDSVWKKTIILGEKCRVPDEEDDTVLYDEKGRKISMYHPKNSGHMASFSGQNSGIDQDSVPGQKLLRLGSQNDELSRKK